MFSETDIVLDVVSALGFNLIQVFLDFQMGA